MILSRRLEYIVSLIEGGVVADIGTDHGKLPYALLSRGIADEVVAIDISAPSLTKAERLLSHGGYESQSRCLLGDGLRPLVGEVVDVAVIAGMGGYEIISILDEPSRGLARRYILSPHRDVEQLRRYLISHSYHIDLDVTVLDGEVYYDILSVSIGVDEYSEDEYRYGRDNLRLRGVDFISYLRHTLDKYVTLLEVVNDARRRELEIEISDIRRILDA